MVELGGQGYQMVFSYFFLGQGEGLGGMEWIDKAWHGTAKGNGF